jgi:hypothetical protein
VGEHLLSLVQELEVFATSDALPDLWRLTSESNTSALLSTLSCRGWRNMRLALDLKDKDEEAVERLCARASCSAAVVAAEKGMFGTQLSRVAEEPAAAADGVADPSGGASTLLCAPPHSISLTAH